MKNNMILTFALTFGALAFSQAFAQMEMPIDEQANQEAPLANEQPAQPMPAPSDNMAQTGAPTDIVAAPTSTSPELRVFSAETYPSLLFTYWEQVAIEDARNSRGQNSTPTDEEIERALGTEDDGMREMPPPEERDIALSGIAYNNSKNWTIWLNGKRVTPDAIPREVIDLKVFKEYIEVKWFDEYTNQIIPIRLRSHQRFNIDNRMFLPG